MGMYTSITPRVDTGSEHVHYLVEIRRGLELAMVGSLSR